jgi:hypothetical protein
MTICAPPEVAILPPVGPMVACMSGGGVGSGVGVGVGVGEGGGVGVGIVGVVGGGDDEPPPLHPARTRHVDTMAPTIACPCGVYATKVRRFLLLLGC